MFGWMEGLVIIGVLVLIFGARKLPQIGSALGLSIKNFKKAVKEDNTRDVEEISSEKKSE